MICNGVLCISRHRIAFYTTKALLPPVQGLLSLQLSVSPGWINTQRPRALCDSLGMLLTLEKEVHWFVNDVWIPPGHTNVGGRERVYTAHVQS